MHLSIGMQRLWPGSAPILISFVVVAVGLAFWAESARAVEPVNASFIGGVAIDGTDPVAYFTEGRPVKGSRAYSYTWNGATWRFASAHNRDLFAANPERYAPQYGGYCAWAVSQGYTAGIDPSAWKIVDGKLYLNYSKGVQAKWLANTKDLIRQADRNWPKILSGS